MIARQGRRPGESLGRATERRTPRGVDCLPAVLPKAACVPGTVSGGLYRGAAAERDDNTHPVNPPGHWPPGPLPDGGFLPTAAGGDRVTSLNAESVKNLLAIHYSAPEWFLTFEVPFDLGNGGRRIDGLAVSRIASRGHEIHAIEVKVNRSDWKAELDNPAKAEGWGKAADRFYVATPKGLVSPVELPAGWGLLEPSGTGMREIVTAGLNPWRERGASCDPISRDMWVFVLRRALNADESTLKVLVDKAYEDGSKYGEQRGRSEGQYREDNARGELGVLRDAVVDFEKASGIKVVGWEPFGFGTSAEDRAKMVRRLITGEKSEDRLDQIENQIRALLHDMEEAKAGRKMAMTPLVSP